VEDSLVPLAEVFRLVGLDDLNAQELEYLPAPSQAVEQSEDNLVAAGR
jgi:hypothetical protein